MCEIYQKKCVSYNTWSLTIRVYKIGKQHSWAQIVCDRLLRQYISTLRRHSALGVLSYEVSLGVLFTPFSLANPERAPSNPLARRESREANSQRDIAMFCKQTFQQYSKRGRQNICVGRSIANIYTYANGFKSNILQEILTISMIYNHI